MRRAAFSPVVVAIAEFVVLLCLSGSGIRLTFEPVPVSTAGTGFAFVLWVG